LSTIEILPNTKKVWRPNTGPQEKFLALPTTIFEGFYGGAAYGGKSDALIMYPIVREWYKIPKFHGIMFRRTFPQLEESLIQRTKTGIGVNGPSYYDLGGKYNDTKHVWTFPEYGSTIRFSYMDDDDDARQHDTAEYHYCAFDELTHFTEFMYTYLLSRVRTSDPRLPAVVRSASNPGNIGHSWVRARFIEPAPHGYTKLYDEYSQSSRIFIPAKLDDNKAGLAADPNYGERLNLLPEAERKAKKDGDWWSFSGQVFTEFRERKHHNEPENALHCVDNLIIPYYYPKIVSIDWGYTHETAVHWHAISPDKRIITYKEFTCSKVPIDIWGAEVGKLCIGEQNIVLNVMDPSAWKTESHGKRIVDQFMEASGLVVEQAVNDRLNGKLNMHNMLRWLPKPSLKPIPTEQFSIDYANRILRMGGVDAYNAYCDRFVEEVPEGNIPRWLIVKEACPQLVRTIPLLVYDEKKTEDVAKFNGDDAYDSARYGLMAADLYIKECQREHEKFVKISKIVQGLQSTGDQTNYYRQMEKLEREAVPIQRANPRRSSGSSKRQVYRPFGN
jgi:hypothetical protein